MTYTAPEPAQRLTRKLSSEGSIIAAFRESLRKEVAERVQKRLLTLSELGNVLGNGRHDSTILIAKHKKRDESYALKVTPKASLTALEREERRDLASLYRLCIHPGIV